MTGEGEPIYSVVEFLVKTLEKKGLLSKEDLDYIKNVLGW